jgi:ribosomal protein S12 methylthiotransferase
VPKVHLLSLGCPKNLVDSDNLLRKLEKLGILYSSRPDESDVILVNTCGFIADAKRESVEEILRLAEKKKKGPRKLIVFGCLAERAGAELKKEIPEIDALWGVADQEKIVEYCEKNIVPRRSRPLKKTGRGEGALCRRAEAADAGEAPGDEAGLSVTEKFIDVPYAYVKIAEGCNRGCTYCAIPGIRGGYRSRPPEEVLNEAEAFLRSGFRELVVVAQDITSYGRDIGGYDLSRLIRDMSSLEGEFWVRLLYLHPASVTDKLLETIAAENKACKYLDMPLQHSEERILKLMGRGGNSRQFEELIRKARDIIPGVNVRTSLIVGFPQEREEDFQRLTEFVRRMKFDRLGAFTYSREEGTPAYTLKGQVPKKTKEERYHKLMGIQSEISLEINRALVGKTFTALVDEAEDGAAAARLYSQAPEIDGVVLIEDARVAKGAFVHVRISAAYDYDLKGEVVR